MSIKIMSMIWDRGPDNQSERFVLLALADYANDEGECWPSIEGIAKKTCLTDRGVRKIIRRLEETRWLEIEAGGGRKNCNLYRIKTLNHVQPEQRSPLNVVPKNPEPRSLNPEPCSAEPSITIIEPSKSDNARDGFEEFWDRYPRRIGKAAARKSYAKAMKATTHDEIMFGLSQQMPSLASREQQYIPHPSTWLNQERWNDEPDHNASRNGTHARADRPGTGMAQAFAAVAERLSRNPEEGGSSGGGFI